MPISEEELDYLVATLANHNAGPETPVLVRKAMSHDGLADIPLAKLKEIHEQLKAGPNLISPAVAFMTSLLMLLKHGVEFNEEGSWLPAISLSNFISLLCLMVAVIVPCSVWNTEALMSELADQIEVQIQLLEAQRPGDRIVGNELVGEDGLRRCFHPSRPVQVAGEDGLPFLAMAQRIEVEGDRTAVEQHLAGDRQMDPMVVQLVMEGKSPEEVQAIMRARRAVAERGEPMPGSGKGEPPI